MRAITLRIDWTCHDAYGDPVVVEVWVDGQHQADVAWECSPVEAAASAKAWLDSRGLGFACDIDERQRQGDSYITLTAWPKRAKRLRT